MMTFKVEGMTCGHCQKAVKAALEGVPGVERADVDLVKGTAVVHGDATPQVLIGAVKGEGYQTTLAS